MAKIKLTLVKSLSGRLKAHQACAKGLGIKKIHKTIEVNDTPENCSTGLVRHATRNGFSRTFGRYRGKFFSQLTLVLFFSDVEALDLSLCSKLKVRLMDNATYLTFKYRLKLSYIK